MVQCLCGRTYKALRLNAKKSDKKWQDNNLVFFLDGLFFMLCVVAAVSGGRFVVFFLFLSSIMLIFTEQGPSSLLSSRITTLGIHLKPSDHPAPTEP